MCGNYLCNIFNVWLVASSVTNKKFWYKGNTRRQCVKLNYFMKYHVQYFEWNAITVDC